MGCPRAVKIAGRRRAHRVARAGEPRPYDVVADICARRAPKRRSAGSAPRGHNTAAS